MPITEARKERLITLITCTSASVYPLTRGKKYTVLAVDEEQTFVRVKSDNGKSRFFPTYCFDLTGADVPVLTAWRFDDLVVDPLNGTDETNNLVEISLQFDDGSLRWCLMGTPDYFKNLLEQRQPYEPMIYAKHLIIARDLKEETVEAILSYIDQQGELLDFSLPLEPDTDDLLTGEEEGT